MGLSLWQVISWVITFPSGQQQTLSSICLIQLLWSLPMGSKSLLLFSPRGCFFFPFSAAPCQCAAKLSELLLHWFHLEAFCTFVFARASTELFCHILTIILYINGALSVQLSAAWPLPWALFISGKYFPVYDLKAKIRLMLVFFIVYISHCSLSV